jgi:hypothetical protein
VAVALLAASLVTPVALDKPPVAVDACWAAGRQATSCDAAFPHYGDPRIAAGGTLAGGVLFCALKPIDIRGLSAAQLSRLKRVFPGGSCDPRKPSREAVPAQPWKSY